MTSGHSVYRDPFISSLLGHPIRCLSFRIWLTLSEAASQACGARMPIWNLHKQMHAQIAPLTDTFTRRGIVQRNTDQFRLETISMIGDAYRALAVLSKHPC